MAMATPTLGPPLLWRSSHPTGFRVALLGQPNSSIGMRKGSSSHGRNRDGKGDQAGCQADPGHDLHPEHAGLRARATRSRGTSMNDDKQVHVLLPPELVRFIDRQRDLGGKDAASRSEVIEAALWRWKAGK